MIPRIYAVNLYKKDTENSDFHEDEAKGKSRIRESWSTPARHFLLRVRLLWSTQD